MTTSQDEVGDLLRDFYAAYGMPNEGPPPGFNVSALGGSEFLAADQCDLLRKAIEDRKTRRHFSICREILEDLATRLTGEEFLREVSSIASASDQEWHELCDGVFWFSLAGLLDRRQNGLPETPFDDRSELPFPVKVRLTVQGSLVLRLYVALVYMREGVLSDLIARGAAPETPVAVELGSC